MKKQKKSSTVKLGYLISGPFVITGVRYKRVNLCTEMTNSGSKSVR